MKEIRTGAKFQGPGGVEYTVVRVLPMPHGDMVEFTADDLDYGAWPPPRRKLYQAPAINILPYLIDEITVP